jgi:hypothetical protein
MRGAGEDGRALAVGANVAATSRVARRSSQRFGVTRETYAAPNGDASAVG